MAKRRLAYFDQALAAYKRGAYREAFEGFKEIAEEGDPAAQCNLAGMYEIGLGVPQSDAQSIYWYRRAAEQGYATAQLSLGIKLRHGFGVARDDVLALTWFRIAADTMEPGEQREELIRNLDFTKSRMSAFQIAEANRQAELWWAARGGHPRDRGDDDEEEEG